ncbi:MAG: hypothetical protein M3Y87_20430, partial [Myxococcota bacterium]|nr:hypothetical protein [Myxococcota bacterium]
GALRAAVESATGGTWTLARATFTRDGVRLAMQGGGRGIELDVQPEATTPRRYKAIGAHAYSYRVEAGVAVDASRRASLDRVIAAIAATTLDITPPLRGDELT